MTGLLVSVAALVVIAALDVMFAGFRASCGRTGLIRHRAADLLAARRGLLLGAVLLAPAGALGLVDLVVRSGRVDAYSDAAELMVAVFAPYGFVVLSALVAYGTLDWRRRFLASAVLLGPMTFLRPVVAIAGGAAATWAAGDVMVGLVIALGIGGLLAVEPLAGRWWYRPIG